jgi:hypothetical protein
MSLWSILGTDFLQKNEACLDWQNNTLSLRQNTVNANIIHISQGFARVSKTTDIFLTFHLFVFEFPVQLLVMFYKVYI